MNQVKNKLIWLLVFSSLISCVDEQETIEPVELIEPIIVPDVFVFMVSGHEGPLSDSESKSYLDADAGRQLEL